MFCINNFGRKSDSQILKVNKLGAVLAVNINCEIFISLFVYFARSTLTYFFNSDKTLKNILKRWEKRYCVLAIKHKPENETFSRLFNFRVHHRGVDNITIYLT